MAINIKLDNFEGPLDLLLHLIKSSEIDIYDIPVAEITDQYIAYLKSMKDMDLEIASEFIVMAATLLEIKSKMLLPSRKTDDDENAEDVDPRAELVEKLVEYKKFKEAAERLKDMDLSNVIFLKPDCIVDDIENKDEYFKNITVENLMVTYKKIMDVYKNKFNKRSLISKNIDYDEFKIEDKIKFIKAQLVIDGRISFKKIIENSCCKLETVVTFLAVLELMKQKMIIAYQAENFSDIILEGLDFKWKTC